MSFLAPTKTLLKKGWTYNPGRMGRGGKNTTWNPKMNTDQLNQFKFLDFEHPRRRPNVWNDYEYRRLGFQEWPKEVGFFNSGDNFELTPEMSWRLFSKNRNEEFWRPDDNERTLIDLMPRIEKNPKEMMPRVEEIFRSHVERFGVDHTIYNAVLQAVAFSRIDFARCEEIFNEMKSQNLEPDAQTYVNMMLACRLGFSSSSSSEKEKAKEKASFYFNEGVRVGALPAVMRLDTEFQMWWDQLERMGSFTEEKGFLAVNDEGAKSKPKDVWALWGWDNRVERKFQTRREFIKSEVTKQSFAGSTLGTVFNSYKREPWHRYKGMLRHDFIGPPKISPSDYFNDVPADTTGEKCGPAF